MNSPRLFAQRIASSIIESPTNDSVIVVAHNGPSGLGSNPEDICGVDFRGSSGGDWGDEDLRIALDLAEQNGQNASLVVFGHMHSSLKGEPHHS